MSDELLFYQLAFLTPGISPREASSLKHIRHSLNLLRYPLFLPQIWHLVTTLVLNFGFFCAFNINDFFAIFFPFLE
jgi:hypothetical protein